MSDSFGLPYRGSLRAIVVRVVLAAAPCLAMAGLSFGAEPLWRSPNHYRLLLKIDCGNVARSNSPAAVQLDFAHLLSDRSIAGAWDEHTIEVIAYDVLCEITGDQRYREVADHEIQWFFESAQSGVTGLLPWGEHLSWDVMLDQPISSGTDYTHEFARPWTLWERSFWLAPEASKNFALGLWNHQKVYLEDACRFAQMAIETYFQDNALPRASFKTDHYETITGADSLALALLKVHAASHHLKITIPSNTIDR